jgi:nitrous oxidase accessory protein NosD
MAREGTSENPYRIEYLLIENTGSEVAINVSNAHLHIVVQPTVVTHGEIHGFYTSIYVLAANGVHIIQSNCTSTYNGLCASHIEDCEIIANSFNGNLTSVDGLELDDAVSNTISENNCARNDVGTYLNEDSTHNLISSNTCSNNTYGIRLESMAGNDDNDIVSNTCDHNHIGISLDLSDRNLA